MSDKSPRERRKASESGPERVIRRFCVEVGETIEHRRLLRGGETVVLAVSGGADSLSLLHAMDRLRERFMLRIEVAHVDHGVRAESAADAEFVAAQAASLGHGFHLAKADPERPKGASLEEHLRNERARLLVEIAGTTGAVRICTGHTRADQAETVLLNMMTGSGRRGLGGMPPARWRTIRPLIDQRRADTEAFCEALGLEPRVDESNNDLAFLRNRVRHEVLPQLREINPRMEGHLAAMADVSRDEDYFLDAAAAAAIPPIVGDAGSAVALETLCDAPIALQRRVVRLLARNEGTALTRRQVEQILHIAHDGDEGARIDLDGPLSARREDGLLLVGRESSATP